MNISLLCTDPAHPVIEHLLKWTEEMSHRGHSVIIVNNKADLNSGDILFLVSCSQMIKDNERDKFQNILVLHASDLPKGRGWSPYIWSILEGATSITVCLLEAKEPVDTGAIWLKKKFNIEGHELLPEINEKLFKTELSLMTQAVENFNNITPIEQTGEPGPYLRKRKPDDSRLEPQKTIAEQFDLLRVADSQRFPAFFDYRGHRYFVKIEKSDNER
jgi:methionyl-tRNA formyltransferase